MRTQNVTVRDALLLKQIFRRTQTWGCAAPLSGEIAVDVVMFKTRR